MILLYCRNCFPPVRSLIGYFEVKWHRTMKMFLAEISERATVQNLWRQRVTAHCYRRMLTDDRRYSEVMNFQLTLRFSGYKINCFPVIKCLMYNSLFIFLSLRQELFVIVMEDFTDHVTHLNTVNHAPQVWDQKDIKVWIPFSCVLTLTRYGKTGKKNK